MAYRRGFVELVNFSFLLLVSFIVDGLAITVSLQAEGLVISHPLSLKNS